MRKGSLVTISTRYSARQRRVSRLFIYMCTTHALTCAHPKYVFSLHISVLFVMQIRHRRKQRISGKNRFRAAVRQVIENRPWLEEDVEEPGDIGDDIQKNIRLIGQPQKRELLSLQVSISAHIMNNRYYFLFNRTLFYREA